MRAIEPTTVAAPTATLHILGIAGSLRAGSYNRALLRAAQEIAPEGMQITAFDLAPIPLYNGDVEAQGDPEPVIALKTAIREADALLIVTPEYNYGVPGVLKNAIDWASRPPGQSPLNGKPVALMGATPGMTGTARAQLQLRQAFVFTQSYPLAGPEVLVPRATEKFDTEGRLTDEATRQHVRRLLERLTEWTRRLRGGDQE
jgi:chromate reductase, NAD(P)H dehydrogenase (quinone)